MAGFSNQPLNLQKAIRQQALVHKQFAEQFRRRNEEFSKRLAEQWRQCNEEFSKRLAEQQRQITEQQQKQFAESWRQFEEQLRRLSNEFAEQLRRLNEEIPEGLQRLGEEGWFLDPEMPAFLLQEAERLFDEHPDEIAEGLSNFFRTRLDVIEEALIDSYPHRGHLFQQAFEAHREGKYGLSIPVFLTQADGIFWDQTSGKQNLFIRQRERACREYASQISNSYVGAYWHPLSITLPLWMTSKERGDSFDGLNRHQVLHGESVDYGTEPNSLKAISLLSYLRWIFSKIDKRASDD